jgi:hypothetical protein
MALTAAIKVEVQDLEETCCEKESEQVLTFLFIYCRYKKLIYAIVYK